MSSKFGVYVLTLLVLLSACKMRPKRPDSMGRSQNAAVGDPSKPGSASQAGIPMFVDSNDPLDSYLSIGPYLQKEFDAAAAGKTVKVYLQIRQENSVEKNIASLKELIGPLHASVSPSLDAALTKKQTTVEFEADVVQLKDAVAKINLAVSGIEVSLPALK